MAPARPVPRVGICGLGAVTAVGLTAWASAAAVRAGLSGFASHRFMVDARGEPLSVAECPLNASAPDLGRRIENCLLAAIAQALVPLAKVPAGALQVELILALPMARPGLPDEFTGPILRTVERAFPGRFARVACVTQGSAGALVALCAVLPQLAAAPDRALVVAGADSWLDPDTLEWLEQTGQLHGAGPRNNAWGFVPGEGAGAVLVLQRDAVPAHGLNMFAQVAGIGTGMETSLIRSSGVCLGEGLTAAFRAAFVGLEPNGRVSDVYCDMNGEPYRADEYGFAVLRCRERFVTASDFVAPADCWGDVGAASAPLGMVLATIAPLKAYARGALSLVWASSQGGERGALLLQRAARV